MRDFPEATYAGLEGRRKPFRRNGAKAEPRKAGNAEALTGHVVPGTVKVGMPSICKNIFIVLKLSYLYVREVEK